jgi:hypothetical protein
MNAIETCDSIELLTLVWKCVVHVAKIAFDLIENELRRPNIAAPDYEILLD